MCIKLRTNHFLNTHTFLNFYQADCIKKCHGLVKENHAISECLGLLRHLSDILSSRHIIGNKETHSVVDSKADLNSSSTSSKNSEYKKHRKRVEQFLSNR